MIKCCNKTLKIKKGNSPAKGDYFYYHCESCGKKAAGGTEKQAGAEFAKLQNSKTNAGSHNTTQSAQAQNTPLNLPAISDRSQIQKWSNDNMSALIKQSAQFIDKPATQRMIEKNIRYISNLSGKNWDKIWSSPEGQESLSYALSEALYHGATLPEMGSIVPYGNTAEFIPSVECYSFALGTGRNAPFKDINITLIHENDQKRIGQKDGNFKIDIEYGIPRGEIVAVAVYATRNDTDKVVGEIYDVERLLEKAKHHSPSYKSFLQEKAEFTRLKVEGKLKQDKSGREYYEKVISYKDKNGNEKSFTKDIYEDDIINPYEGPDRPEMLRKAAGKSFFRPYMRTRNASAMAEEWSGEDFDNEESREKTADNVLNKAMGQFSDSAHDGKIKDAEIIPDSDSENKDEDLKDL